jgi:hypothetical protein
VSSGSTAYSEAEAVVVDGAGNVYVAGSFQGLASFGTNTLISPNAYEAFVVKLDAFGNFLWARQTVGSVADYAKSVAVDGVGNVYVAGKFYGTANFGATTLTNSTNGGVFNNDGFVAKLDAAGNFLWAKQTGSTNGDVRSVAVDGSGNSYLTGLFQGTVSFGGTTLTNTIPDHNAFIAKMDTAGNFLWARQVAGGTNKAEAVALDGIGGVYLIGEFSGTATFGATTLANSGGRSTFIAKLDTSGNALWAKQTGGSAYYNRGKSVAADGAGNVVVAGQIVAGLIGDTTSFGAITVTNNSGKDIAFAAKLDSAGNFLWARQGGGTTNHSGYSVALDGAGSAYLAGAFSDSGSFGTNTLVSRGSTDAFVTKLDTAGNFLWAKQAGGSTDDFAGSVAADGSGNVYLAGSYRGMASFGDTTLTNGNGPFGGAFITKLGIPVPPVITAQPVGQTFGLGGGVVLGVAANGTALKYQWQFNRTNIVGATNAALALNNLTVANVGAYRVIVSNAAGGVTSQEVSLLFFGDLKFYSGTTLAGPIGQQFRVDYTDVLGGVSNWLTLTNVTLPASPYLVIDPTSPGRTNRFYRAVPLP